MAEEKIFAGGGGNNAKNNNGNGGNNGEKIKRRRGKRPPFRGGKRPDKNQAGAANENKAEVASGVKNNVTGNMTGNAAGNATNNVAKDINKDLNKDAGNVKNEASGKGATQPKQNQNQNGEQGRGNFKGGNKNGNKGGKGRGNRDNKDNKDNRDNRDNKDNRDSRDRRNGKRREETVQDIPMYKILSGATVTDETVNDAYDETQDASYSAGAGGSDDKERFRYIPDHWFEDEAPQPEPYDESKLIEIVGVRFKDTGKVYYFAPMGYVCPEGQNVIVETARGLEYGTVTISNRLERPETLVAALRPVVRLATEADTKKHEQNTEREAEAFSVCQEKIIKHQLDMKLIEAEYTFDNSKLTFYFSADGRIDFRELVKDLASVFRTRIELRQIGIRDEAKLLGGLGICGRPFCCSTFLYDFNQVSIRMAKEQNLSLNSAKISGTCGRLMCCLRYECETYEEEMKRTPRTDSIVKTKDGTGYVIESQPLAGIVKVKLGEAEDAVIKTYSRDEVTVIGRRKSAQNEPSINEDSDIIPDSDDI